MRKEADATSRSPDGVSPAVLQVPEEEVQEKHDPPRAFKLDVDEAKMLHGDAIGEMASHFSGTDWQRQLAFGAMLLAEGAASATRAAFLQGIIDDEPEANKFFNRFHKKLERLLSESMKQASTGVKVQPSQKVKGRLKKERRERERRARKSPGA